MVYAHAFRSNCSRHKNLKQKAKSPIKNTKKGNNAKGVDKIYNYKQMQIFAKDHDIKLPERMNYYNSYWSSPIIKSYVGYYTVKEKLFGLVPLNLQLSKILKQTFNIIDEDTKIKLVLFGIQITIPSLGSSSNTISYSAIT